MQSFYNRYYNSIVYFFSNNDSVGAGRLLRQLDCTRIYNLEKEIIRAIRNGVEEQIPEKIKEWISALVHSTSPARVKQGLDILTSIHEFGNRRWIRIKGFMIICPLMEKEEYYYHAVGLYKSGHYLVSLQMLTISLEFDNGWKEPLFLKKLIERKLRKDAVKLMSATGFSVGLVAFGYILALAKKKKF